MKNDQPLEIKDFVYLMLMKLADNSQIMNSKSQKIVAIPSNYKQVIENILCSDNGWKNKFSQLIDIEEYFDDHFFWERKLANTLKKILQELNKTYRYDLISDNIFIEFSQMEIDEIMKKYQNEEINDNMDHFTNLLVDYIYTREYQERFTDYSARTIQKMKDLNSEKMNQEREYTKRKVLIP
ncbi:MAG: hypothetical protein E7313_07675 [Clostridiales bacterium]|nr:hypothetical protein [Clostridiales bacterium]